LALEGSPLKRLPRPRPDAQSAAGRGLLKQFQVELLIEPPDQVFSASTVCSSSTAWLPPVAANRCAQTNNGGRPGAEELIAADVLFALSAAGSSDTDHSGQAVKADALFNEAGYLPAFFSAV
jgi:hypothetical protein